MLVNNMDTNTTVEVTKADIEKQRKLLEAQCAEMEKEINKKTSKQIVSVHKSSRK